MSMWDKTIDWLERRLNLSEIFSWITTFGISYAPINPDQPVREAAKQAFLSPLPSYQRWPHIFGLLTFVTFLLEVVTGLLLAFYFQPSTGNAYESTRLIIRDTSFGWYIHQMHFWGGQILVVLLLVRLLRFLMHRVYRPPRELIWMFGVILLFLAVQSCLTGELLPWDQKSYWTTMRGLELLNEMPILGSLLRYFVGGFTLGTSLLIRFYLLHVIFLPMLIFTFFYLHFSTVRRVGLSSVPELDEKARPIYPGHVMNLMIILLAIFGGILTLAILFPSSFLSKADPFQTPTGISVSWYLLPLYGFFELIPAAIARWLTFLALGFFLLLPFVDKQADLPFQKRPFQTGIAILIFLFVIYLTYFGYSQRG